MFADGDGESSYGILHSLDHTNGGHPPFLHRSISAPAIAEHVSDAILPEYDDFENETNHDPSSSYYNNNPSRLNPRMPKPVRAFHHSENSEMPGFEPGGFFEEGKQKSILGSFIMDNKPMTPVDKIQEDFPSTPSAVYSSRLAKIKELEMEQSDFAEETTVIPPAPILSLNIPVKTVHNTDPVSRGSTPTPTMNHIPQHPSSPHIENSLEQATMSLQNMYVSGGFEENVNMQQQQQQPIQINDMQQQQQQQFQNLRTSNIRQAPIPQVVYNHTANGGMTMTMTSSNSSNNMQQQSVLSNNVNNMSDMVQQQQYLRAQQMPVQQVGGGGMGVGGVGVGVGMQGIQGMGMGMMPQQMQVQYSSQMNLSQQQQQQQMLQMQSGQQQQQQTHHYYMPQQQPSGQVSGMSMNHNLTLSHPSNQIQQMYVDPVYYRVPNGPAMGMYQQELVYSSPVDTVGVGVGGPQDQMSYIQYQTTPNYWQTSGGQSVVGGGGDQQQQQVLLVSSGNVPVNGRDMNIMPGSRRVMPMYTQQGQGVVGVGMDPSQSMSMSMQQQSQTQSGGIRSFVPGGQVMQSGVGVGVGGQLQSPLPMNMNMNNMNSMNMVGQRQLLSNGMMSSLSSSLSPPPIIIGGNSNSNNKLQSPNMMYKSQDQMKMYRDDNSSISSGGQSQYRDGSGGGSMSMSGSSGQGAMDSIENERYLQMQEDIRQLNASNGMGGRNGGRGDKDRNNAAAAAGRGAVDRARVGGATTPTLVRDVLVEDFRNTYGKSRQWELRDLLGHVVAFCQDQHGSRFIQQRLEVATDAEKQFIFEEVLPNAHSLMTDVFGNYVIQKLFEYGAPEQCETLASLISGQAVPLALQMYGCRVIQKALEYVSTQRLVSLVSEFEGAQVLRCVHDQNGNHVIQKCIEVVCRVAKEAPVDVSEYLNSRIQFIILSFQGRVRELSMHPYGCRVVQRILEHCNNTQKGNLLEELRLCCIELVQDQYGNYVIQHVMQHGWETDRAILVKEVQEHLLDFSQHKFASNVVEKCLQYASKKDRDEMIWTIIKVTFDLANPVDAKTGHCVLESMVRDPYANYVVQKVIDVSDERQRGAIIKYVRENIVQLRRYTYGKHIIVRLEKVSGEKF